MTDAGARLGTAGALARARAEERRLRSELARLVAEERRARAEAERLSGRAALEGASAEVASASARQAARAGALRADIDAARQSLRETEGTVARLEADVDGAPRE